MTDHPPTLSASCLEPQGQLALVPHSAGHYRKISCLPYCRPTGDCDGCSHLLLFSL